jgi:hypothetical protein
MITTMARPSGPPVCLASAFVFFLGLPDPAAFAVTDPACRTENWLIMGRGEGNTITHAGPFGLRFTAIVDQTVTAEYAIRPEHDERI